MKICYLCGKENPENKDHVPPKILLNKGSYNRQNRITLPTHISCNNGYSKDEEYVRDIIALLSKDSIHAKEMLEKTLRSVSKNEATGKLELLLDAGVFSENQFYPKNIDRNRFHRVAMKIFRGIIFNDLHLVVEDKFLECFFTSLDEYEYQLRNVNEASQHYWRMVLLSKMNNEMKDENLIIKRRYLRILNDEGSQIRGFFGLGIHQVYFGGFLKIGVSDDFDHKKYKIITIDERT